MLGRHCNEQTLRLNDRLLCKTYRPDWTDFTSKNLNLATYIVTQNEAKINDKNSNQGSTAFLC